MPREKKERSKNGGKLKRKCIIRNVGSIFLVLISVAFDSNLRPSFCCC